MVRLNQQSPLISKRKTMPSMFKPSPPKHVVGGLSQTITEFQQPRVISPNTRIHSNGTGQL